MKRLVLSIILWMLLSSNSCEAPPGAEIVYRIWFKNTTNQPYSYIVSYNYPDTLIPENYNMLRGAPANKRAPFDSQKKWEKVFKEDLPGDTLSIFIFDEIVTPDNWDQVRSNYNIAKRYDLSLRDLERINFTVTHPPDSTMKGVKMYP